MTVSSPPTYRNTRTNFYTDKASDNSPVGSIISTFKAITGVYDNSYIPLDPYNVLPGNSNTPNNPEHQYPGYLYCDGSEYNISDFPVLYSIIGNDYGGDSRRGITIVDGGSGYAAGTTITFDAAPTGGTTIEGSLTIDNGVVIAVNITESGAGYLTEPSFTIANAGGGTGLDLEINIGAGTVRGINVDNVFEHWGESRSLGTFKVPDLKTRKVVGYGNVYGSGSPSIGLLTLGAGGNNGNIKQGGSWYFDKASQAGYFSLGTITTTGYENITDSISTRVIGSQKVSITMDPRRLTRVPEHSHFVYHTSTQQTITWPSGFGNDDRYLANYEDFNSRADRWSPVGGIQYEHKHGLSKNVMQSRQVATYDVFDWNVGAEGTGSIKFSDPVDGDFYFASGDLGAGTWEEQTYVPNTLFKIFTDTDDIGGRTRILAGDPIISYNQELEYTGSTNVSFPNNWAVMQVTIAGGGGSGSNGIAAGSDGNDTNVKVTAGTGSSGILLDVTAGGGQGGGKTTNFTSYGPGGAITKSGTKISELMFQSELTFNGTAGQQGSGPGGTYPGSTYPQSNPPNQAGLGGSASVGPNMTVGVGGGTDGIHTYIGNSGSSNNTYTYNPSGNSLQTCNLQTGSEFKLIRFTIKGAAGQVSQRAASGTTGHGGIIGGIGSPGAVMILEVKDPGDSDTYAFTIFAGAMGTSQSGAPGDDGPGGGGYGGAGGAGYANGGGGLGGDGAVDDGGGGGGVSAVLLSTQLVAGAGGGGGGGGMQDSTSYPYNGENGQGMDNNKDVYVSGSSNLFTGGGNRGGNYGCVGGGGGGGGGGCSTSSQGGGGGGGEGGDPQGTGGGGGHQGGKGGHTGQSAYNTTYFDFINCTLSNSGNGQVVVYTEEDDSAWSPGGGGGGAGALVSFTVYKEDLTGASSVALTMNSSVASGPTGVGDGMSPYARIGFGEITGWKNEQSITSTGDIVIKASEGIELYASGSGTGDGGGFALPVTQVPTVEFVGGGGSNAAATATVADGKVTGITLTNGGTGYTAAPQVRIIDGAGTRAFATATVETGGNRAVTAVTLSTQVVPEDYKRYVKISGTEQKRWIIIKEQDCSNVTRFNVKACRGNGINGGNTPENSGDQLKIFYNTDLSEDNWTFLDVIVPMPDENDATGAKYEGTGQGTNPTNWYWYGTDLPSAAQKPNTRFKIEQDRGAVGDYTIDSDHYGICDFIYEYKEVTELVFQAASNKMSTSVDQLNYEIDAAPTALYTAGAIGGETVLKLTAQVPLIPDAAIDPDRNIPLIEPYHLTKYLIKAF
tara:strand:- start:232 stop:4098 length:3867 start_codon:yes stop_codon:yes gene_type:complete